VRKLCLKCAAISELDPYTSASECRQCGAIYAKLEAAVIAKAEREAIARSAAAEKTASLPAVRAEVAVTRPSRVVALNARTQPSLDAITIEPNDERERRGNRIAYVGCALLAVGVFLPIVTMPVVGSINYFANGKGDGTILLIVAMIGAGLVFMRKFVPSAIAGGLAVATLAFTGWRISSALNSMHETLANDLKGNPFGGIATAFASSVQISWGWIVLLAGGLMLIGGSLYSRQRRRLEG
jgi:hypothetical protein